MAENTRYFIDMDGTLAVFNSVKSEEELFEKGYFENLDMQENICLAVSELSREIPNNVYILSSYLEDSKFALNEKKNWLKKNVPEIPEKNWLFVPCGNRKADYVPNGIKPTDVLVDDYGVNIKEWKEACPDAKYVKVCRDENDIEVEKSKISEEYIGFISNDLHETEILEIITLGGERSMTFNEAKQEYDKKYYAGLEKTGLFYAFSDESFEEQKKPGTTAKDYTSYFGVGDVIHIDDVPKLEHFLEIEAPELKKDFLSKISKEDFILHELRDNECGYTGDISDAVDSVVQYYEIDKETATKEVQSVYNHAYKEEEPMPSIEDFNEKNTFDIGLSENISNEISEEMGHSR